MKFRGQEMNSGETRYMNPGVHECEIVIGKEKRFNNAEGIERHVVSIGFKNAVGEIVFDDYYLNPEALWRLEKLFRSAGIQKDDVDLNDLGGQFVVVRVKQESYTKKDGTLGTKSAIENVLPAGTKIESNSEAEPEKTEKKADPF
jgi:hypothetical protein